MKNLLVIGAKEDFFQNLKSNLQPLGIKADLADNSYQALHKSTLTSYDVLAIDSGLPLVSCAQTIEIFRKIDKKMAMVVMISADTPKRDAEKLIQLSTQYLRYPFTVEEFKNKIHLALGMRPVQSFLYQLQISQNDVGFVGASPQMKEIYTAIGKVKDAEINVLISGETGTGKELVAKAIHFNGHRGAHPFVSLNCMAIPETLLESELFGHERGSFTGAIKRTIGRFEQANRGTLFLDEIGEMPLTTQIKILRALEEKAVERVGGREKIEVDARLVSATNKNLREEIARGTFREDLFYRLSTFPIHIPPLRERKEDIADLARFFMQKFNQKLEKNVEEIAAETMDYLLFYSWPGNVRELENVIERAVLLADGKTLLPGHLPDSVLVPPSRAGSCFPQPGDIRPLEELEREAIENALERTGGNVEIAARKLKIGTATLYRKIRFFQIEKNK